MYIRTLRSVVIGLGLLLVLNVGIAGPAAPVTEDEINRILALSDDDPRRALALAAHALGRLEPQKEPAKTLKLAHVVADALVWLADYGRAVTVAAEALKLARELGDREAERRLLIASGFSHQYLNDSVAAFRDLQLALRLAEQQAAARDIFEARLLLAGLLTEADATDLALEEIRLAQILLDEGKTGATQSDIDYQLAATYRRIGDTDRAIEITNRVIVSDRSLPSNEQSSASALRLLGALQLEKKSYPEAEAASQAAYAIFAKAGSKYNAAVASRDLAAAICARGMLESAERRFEAAQSDFAGERADDQVVRSQVARARCLNQSGKFREARVQAEQARSLAARARVRDASVPALEQLVAASFGLRDWKAAVEQQRELAALQTAAQAADRARQLSMRQMWLDQGRDRAALVRAQRELADTQSQRSRERWIATAVGSVLAAVTALLAAIVWLRRRAVPALALPSTIAAQTDTTARPLYERRHAIAFLQYHLDTVDTQPAPAELLCGLGAVQGLDEVNKIRGWDGGDALLIEAARGLEARTPPPALVARIGGNRVFVALQGLSHRDAVRWFDAARLLSARSASPQAGLQRTPSFSFGIARQRPAESIGSFLERLDFLLLESQREGGLGVAADLADRANNKWGEPQPTRTDNPDNAASARLSTDTAV
jgi:GGDEF domain-containing protein